MTIDLPALMCAVDDERHRRRVTWTRVAEETGIKSSTLSDLKHGKRRPATDTFVSLLHWLDFPPQELGELMKQIIRET
jgi:transcriptional regulator with XRE-family HTH domain